MSIKEKDLQTIEQLSDGDKLRVVTSDGDSRNVDAEEIGRKSLICHLVTVDGQQARKLDKTYGEIFNAMSSGMNVMLVSEESQSGVDRGIYLFSHLNYYEELYYVSINGLSFNFLGGELNDYPTEDMG